MHKKNAQQAIHQSAQTLFQQKGWKKVAVQDICRQAKVSRVTFYKYFRNKIDLLEKIMLAHKHDVCTALSALAEQAHTMADVINGIGALQKQAWATAYSSVLLDDIHHHSDTRLAAFITTLEAEKYAFMQQFFQRLQHKKLLNDRLPLPLINIYLKMINDMMRHPMVQAAYADQISQLPQDMIQLMMYGLAYREASPAATKA